MNLFGNVRRRKFYIKNFYFVILIRCILIQPNYVSAHKFVYWFKKTEDSKILLYSEIQISNMIINKNHYDNYLNVYFNLNEALQNDLTHVFTYKIENFINFEVFDGILLTNILKNMNGKIECDFDLTYILKLTEDVSSPFENIDFCQFNALILTLKHLKAIKHKNILKLLENIIFRIYANQYSSDLNKKYFVFEKIFHRDTLKILDFCDKKILISAFLHNFMLSHVFYKDNLIILKSNKDYFETGIFNEHIPYKNLLINDYKAFCSLENVFRNLRILNIFQNLLIEIDIKSLIINNFEESETLKTNFYFFKHIAPSFKSIMISNLLGSSESILYELNRAIDTNLEYFGLQNLIVNNNYLVFFLRNQKLKGIILNSVIMNIDIYYFDAYIEKNQILEYIDLKNTETMFTWIRFLEQINLQKIILSFDSDSVEKNFVEGWDSLDKTLSVRHLEINFFDYKISKEFCKFLRNFQSLQTLKLYNYEPNEKINRYFHRVIKCMKELETLIIEHEYFSNKFLNSLFQNKGIKVLHINNYIFKKKILKLKLFKSNHHLTDLSLRSIDISGSSLAQIFQLKNLKSLSLKFCGLQAIEDLKSLHFMARNIRTLDLTGSDLNFSRYFDILGKQNSLKKLHLSGSNLHLCSLTKLNSNCNLTLKALSYKWGILSLDDLNRIKSFEILVKLNISRCEFINTSLYELGENCKFLKSLKYLNMSCVELKLNDFLYLRNFKHLRNLKISLSGIALYKFNFSINSYSTNYFFSKKIYKDNSDYNIIEYFNEVNISENFVYI